MSYDGSFRDSICRYQGYLRLLSLILIFLLILNIMAFWLNPSVGLGSLLDPAFWSATTGDDSVEIAKLNTLALVGFLGVIMPLITYCTRMQDA